MEIKAIGIDAQIDNVLFGVSANEKEQAENKRRFIHNRLGSVVSVNGTRIYDPVIKGEDIYYNLQPCPDQLKHLLKDGQRKYYYPIQYANIELKETSHGKRYYQRDNIGKCKYTVSFHDGYETHNDGSPFYGIEIFKNKKKVQQFISGLIAQGYRYKTYDL